MPSGLVYPLRTNKRAAVAWLAGKLARVHLKVMRFIGGSIQIQGETLVKIALAYQHLLSTFSARLCEAALSLNGTFREERHIRPRRLKLE